MSLQRFSAQRAILIAAICLILAALACGDVSPDDPRLQPPISNSGVTFADFLRRLSAVPSGGVMAPWIVEPPDLAFNVGTELTVSGWAVSSEDKPWWSTEGTSEVTVYQVTPDASLLRVESAGNALATVQVGTDRSWSAQVTLPEPRVYLAARVRTSWGESPFSNIVYVTHGELAPLTIESPAEGEIIQNDRVTLSGTGEPRAGLTLSVNGQRVPISTTVGSDGRWTLADVPLAIRPFDFNNPTADPNQNELIVEAAATRQQASRTVRRVEPVRLAWPFGTGEGANFQPDVSTGYVTAFYGNDWHRYSCNSSHPALDIQDMTRREIHSVASGTVVAVGTDKRGSNYLIVDHGGWGVLYLHIVEDANALRRSGIQTGTEVVRGQVIATEGGSGGFAVHLHIGVAIWQPKADRSQANSFFAGTPVNLNPPSSLRNHFSAMNVDLYDMWGGAYCHPDGCWNIDWTQVQLNPSTLPSSNYQTACWNEGLWSTGFSPFSTRAEYCTRHPAECLCTK